MTSKPGCAFIFFFIALALATQNTQKEQTTGNIYKLSYNLHP